MAVPTNYTELYEVLKAIKANHPDMYPIGNRNGTAQPDGVLQLLLRYRL